MSLALDIVTIVAVSAGAFFFLAGTVGSAPLPRCAHAPACAHQGGQPRPGSRGARVAAVGRKPARRPQAGLRLAARAAGRGDGLPAHSARRADERSERPAPRRAATMTIASALEMVLAAVVLGLAIWTIAARETFAAVAGFVAYGLLLALVWVRLDAVDVALTEAAIGGGLGGVLLLGCGGALADDRNAGGGGTSRRDPAPGGRGALGDGRGRARGRRAVPARSRAHAGAGGCRERRGNRPRQSGHERVDGVSRHGHHAGEGRAPARPGRRVVAGARPLLGRTPGAAPPGRSARRARLPRAAAAAGGHRRRHLHPLGREPTIPAGRSRAARSSPPCGCWS